MKNRWLDTKEFPFKSNYLEIKGQKLHYVDEGIGNPIIFVHGTPSWSFDFRHCIKTLKNNFRCIALDHIGFGLSDKPQNYDYSLENHVNNLEQLINHLNLQEFTIVVHDFGGPIGLNMAIKNHSKIKKIIILNSWLWSSKNDPEFIKFSKILKSPLLPFLYKYFNFSARFVLPSTFGSKKISKKVLKNYTKPFSNKNERYGTIAFAKSLLNDQDRFEELWNTKEKIATKPTLFLWGMIDPVITPKYLQKFKKGFPNHKTVKFETCGHFPQEEEYQEVAKQIFEFLK